MQISPRPFTTIKPNQGTAYARTECACKTLGVKCNPRNSKCEDGVRLVPIQLLDVAGLVPDAHLGKGMGNQFLNDLMTAEGLIHVVDLSGSTDAFGNPCEDRNPEQDVQFLEDEIDWWIKGILEKNWAAVQRKAKTGKTLWEAVCEQVAGLGMSQDKTREAVEAGSSDLLELARRIRRENKPVLLAGNKIDLASSQVNYEKLKTTRSVLPASAECELALRRANKAGLIKYVPGAPDFSYLKKPSPQQEQALEIVKRSVLTKYKGTGVQQVIDTLIFEKLGYIAVYPVEDENKFCDKDSRVLPDVFLMKKGTTALDLAFKVHTDIGKNFVGALDCRTKKKIGKDQPLKHGDVIKIFAR